VDTSRADDRQRSRAKRRRRNIWIAIGSVFLVLVLAAGAAIWSVYARWGNTETIEEAFPDESLRPEENTTGSMNVLLLGSDSRDTAGETNLDDIGSRADTMIVAHIPADRSGVQLMSIMRDTYVDIPGVGRDKINAALAYGGVSLVVQTVEGLIDQRIDHVMVVDFEGFKDITDAIGGVTVNNPQEFTSGSPTNEHYPAGQITLSGDRALAFVRERYAFTDGDYQRVVNQQLFLKAVADKMLSRDVLTNPVTLNSLLDSVVPYVARDSELTVNAMVSLGTSLSSIKSSDITSFTMPTNGTGMEGSQSVVYLNEDELPTLQEHFKNDTLGTYDPPAR
jgi:LCP family protein required for cell wall assembly